MKKKQTQEETIEFVDKTVEAKKSGKDQKLFFRDKFRKIHGAVTSTYDPFAHENVLRTPSPSINNIFGKTHGFPRGYSMLLWGEPKTGKTLICNAFVGQIHRDFPDAHVVKFDTEFRHDGQMSAETAAAFGIDLDRYHIIQVNKPEEVFDVFEKEIGALAEAGCDIALCIIDSLSGIQGRREANSETVSQHNIGDHAQTLGIGLKRILPVQRKHRISLIATAHARAELDMWEAKKSKTKAQASFGAKHHCEYFVYVERNRTKDGEKDIFGRVMEDTTRTDMNDDAEKTGHKIRVWMQDSSVSVPGRQGEFTLDYNRGIINTHHEIYLLGLKRGIIQREGNKSLILKDQKYTSAGGKTARDLVLTALENDVSLQAYVIQELLEDEKAPRVKPQLSEEDKAEVAALGTVVEEADEE